VRFRSGGKRFRARRWQLLNLSTLDERGAPHSRWGSDAWLSTVYRVASKSNI
jgi:hypothetical protein